MYGYVGGLNQIHPEMVLAIPYFGSAAPGPALYVAYMPRTRIRSGARGFRCEPAQFRGGVPIPDVNIGGTSTKKGSDDSRSLIGDDGER